MRYSPVAKARLAAGSVLLASPAYAARIGELEETGILDQLVEFISFGSQTALNTAIGCALLGVLGGLLGCFLILRRMALVGDALGHSLLPGIAIAFLIVGTKSTPVLLVGAIVSGVIYSLLLGFLTRQRRTKNDSVLGLTFTAFFGLGIVLLSYIQSSPTGSQAGLDKFLFGQAAAISPTDIGVISGVLVAALVTVIVFYRPFLALSFDIDFAVSYGLSVRLYHYLMMALFTLAIVVSIQAVGVVLVSALLIIPAATAHLLVTRLPAMLLLAALIGLLAGLIGAFCSYVFAGIPTGPMVVLAAAVMFLLVFTLSPREGVLTRWIRRYRPRKRFERENILKAVLELASEKALPSAEVSLEALQSETNLGAKALRKQINFLGRLGLLLMTPEGKVSLTVDGEREARRILRNHALWETYLEKYSVIAPDHVHYDAERIEHVLTPEVVAQLEELLGDRVTGLTDPHKAGR